MPAKKPKRPTPKPDPPSVEEAARIVHAAWAQDEARETMVWLSMMLGPRRGERAALKWDDLLLDDKAVKIARSYSVRGGVKREKATKTHQERFVSLDDDSVEMLKLHWAKYFAAILELEPGRAEDLDTAMGTGEDSEALPAATWITR